MDLAMDRPSPKLEAIQFRPFTIDKVMGPLTYHLVLPREWKINNVFHRSKLHPVTPDLIQGRRNEVTNPHDVTDCPYDIRPNGRTQPGTAPTPTTTNDNMPAALPSHTQARCGRRVQPNARLTHSTNNTTTLALGIVGATIHKVGLIEYPSPQYDPHTPMPNLAILTAEKRESLQKILKSLELVPMRSPTPLKRAITIRTGTREDPIEYVTQLNTPPPVIKEEITDMGTIIEFNTTSPVVVIPSPLPEELLIPPYFEDHATQQPSLSLLMTLAHITSGLTVEYRGINLDQIMWLASAAYTKKHEDPERSSQALEADMRSHWREMHP